MNVLQWDFDFVKNALKWQMKMSRRSLSLSLPLCVFVNAYGLCAERDDNGVGNKWKHCEKRINKNKGWVKWMVPKKNV